MIKASELRIGNLLADSLCGFFNVITVESINEKGVNLELVQQGHSYSHWEEIQPVYSFHELFGIALTEEWLKRFGFEKPAHSWNGKIFHLSEWDLYPLNWCVAMDKNGAIIFEKLKYVHQLQNLFFALTGTELTTNELKNGKDE